MPKRFTPFVLIECENARPSSVWEFALRGGPDKLLHLDLDLRLPSQTYMRQALNLLPEEVPYFGKPIAFTVNFRNDFAVKYSTKGDVLEVLDHAVTHGFGSVTLTAADSEAQAWLDKATGALLEPAGTVH